MKTMVLGRLSDLEREEFGSSPTVQQGSRAERFILYSTRSCQPLLIFCVRGHLGPCGLGAQVSEAVGQPWQMAPCSRLHSRVGGEGKVIHGTSQHLQSERVESDSVPFVRVLGLVTLYSSCTFKPCLFFFFFPVPHGIQGWCGLGIWGSLR